MNAATYGEALRRVRARKKVSQDELVRRTGMDRSYVSRVENGRITMPQEDSRERFARALGVTNEEIFAEMGLVTEERPEYAAGVDMEEHEVRVILDQLTNEDRSLVVDFIQLLYRRHQARFE